MTRKFYFFIGTEAELIKLFPVLKEFIKKKIRFKIIASGQNNLTQSYFLKELNISPDIQLSNEVSNDNPLDLVTWSIKTFLTNFFKLRNEFNTQNKKNTILIVHGDTVSTVMGALFGKLFGLKVAHIEAGLRSFNFLSPIPEEIDRALTLKLTNIHFSPNAWALKNISNEKGEKINTQQNTLYETFKFVIEKKQENQLIKKLKGKKYFVLIIHRQENLLRKKLVLSILKNIFKDTSNFTCVFVLHKTTRVLLEAEGELNNLKNKKNLILSDRLDYPVFLSLVKNSQFFITDGGSNQEEAYYLGKPCLILRNRTERIEGLGENVALSKFNLNTIREFIKNYKKYQRPELISKVAPGKIIVDYLTK